MLTSQQFREELKLIAFRIGSQKDLAKQWGVSAQQLSFAITGKRPPCDAILKGIGYEAVVTTQYRRVDPATPAEIVASDRQA
jgi:hypothetical protein